MATKKNETMKCPSCGAALARSEKANCICGAKLRLLVPLFKAQAEPFGWKWALAEQAGR